MMMIFQSTGWHWQVPSLHRVFNRHSVYQTLLGHRQISNESRNVRTRHGAELLSSLMKEDKVPKGPGPWRRQSRSLRHRSDLEHPDRCPHLAHPLLEKEAAAGATWEADNRSELENVPCERTIGLNL